MSGRVRRPDRTPASVAAETREEIESHIEMQVADLVAAGWSREAAADEALRRFGDRGRFERETVDVDRRHLARARRRGIAADLAQDGRLAVRQLRRQPAFAVAAMLIIGLGVGAGASVFAVVDAALFRPLPFERGDQLVYLWDQQPGQNTGPSLPEFRDWEREADFLAGAAAIYSRDQRWQTEAGWDVVRATFVAGDMGRVAGPPLLGRWFTPAEQRGAAQVVVLDERTWRTRFAARPDVLGARLRLEQGPHVVVGVAQAELDLLRVAGRDRGPTTMWLPLRELPFMERGTHFMTAVGRLEQGVSPAQAAARGDLLERRLQQAAISRHGLTVEPARAVLAGGIRPLLMALSGAALLVLLAVCANLGNLFLWKSLARSRDFTVRAAVGATRGRLVRQILTESAVLGLAGGVCGLVAAQLFLGTTRAVAGGAGALAPVTALDARVALFAAGLSLLVGLSFGLWPALRASRVDLAAELKREAGTLAGGASSPWRRKVLVAVEVALGVVLVAASGLLVRSLLRMLEEDPGFVPGQVVAFQVATPEARYDEAAAVRLDRELRRRAGALPGVMAIGAASELPLEGRDTTGDFEVVGRAYEQDALPQVKKRIVGPGYFDALRIPIVRGRDLRESDGEGAAGVVVISQELARRHFPGQDPVGRRVRFHWGPGDEQEVVGVVGDVRHDGLDRPVDEVVYRPVAQMPRRQLRFVMRAADPANAVGAVRRELARIDPMLALHQVTTMEQIVSAAIAPRRRIIAVLAGFALIAALLAAVGAYAVTSQMVSMRTREIGLRMALGAQPGDIRRLMVREGAIMIGLGAAAGLLGALAGARVLASMLYGISAHDPATLAASVALLAAVAAIAIYLPARRAARIEPMIALRLV